MNQILNVFPYHIIFMSLMQYRINLCLQVGVKGNPKGVNRGLDCDVIVAEVFSSSSSLL